MARLNITALHTALVETLRGGAPDANGQPAERATSPGVGTPCRHCLDTVPQGDAMLILAHRPFPSLHPYAETGPIFLCADGCERYIGVILPPAARTSPTYLLKGYGRDDRIVYGSGAITPAAEITDYAASLLERPEIAYFHVRSATNNCYLMRIDRA